MRINLVNGEWHVGLDGRPQTACGMRVSIHYSHWQPTYDIWCVACREALGDSFSKSAAIKDALEVVHVGNPYVLARVNQGTAELSASLVAASSCGWGRPGIRTNKPASCLACLAHVGRP